MPVNLVHVVHDGAPRWGVLRDGAVTLVPGSFATTGDLIRANPVERLRDLDGPTIPETTLPDGGLRLLSPVTRNQQFICQGANYRQHMIESGMDPDAKTFNMIFTKATSCIVPADSCVVKPVDIRFLDYEIELGMVLKRDLAGPERITDADLPDLVAGLVIVNDYSARDVQIPQMQFYKGKSYRTFGPVGPRLVLLEPDDFARLGELDLLLTVDGEPRQTDRVANMVYGPAETLTELSGVQDLFAGDLLSTGTPAGCALHLPPPAARNAAAGLSEAEKWAMFFRLQATRPQYLKAGQVVEARIATPDGAIDLGVQRNRVVDAACHPVT